jgi:hypothetical protein
VPDGTVVVVVVGGEGVVVVVEGGGVVVVGAVGGVVPGTSVEVVDSCAVEVAVA